MKVLTLFLHMIYFQYIKSQLTNTSSTNDTTANPTDDSDNSSTAFLADLNYADMSWVLVASTLVMLMTPALGFFYGGLVKTKNMMSMLGQTLTIYAIIAALWTLLGFSLVFGPTSNNGLIGGLDNGALINTGFAGSSYSPTISYFLFFFYQMQFACITPALIIGGVAERVRFMPLIIFSFIWHLIVYCPIAHWNWNTNGWLNLLGTKDFAGGNVIHISSGVAALAIVLYLENEPIRKSLKKNNKYVKQEYKKIDGEDEIVVVNQNFSQNSLVFVVIGTMLLWFGWFGFNGGSALAMNQKAILAVVNTNVAPAISLITWVILDLIIKRRPTVSGMCCAIVCGLVGITPAAGIVRVWASVVIGIFSTIGPYFFVYLRDKYKFFDDRLDVFGCHGVGGIIGGITTGLFYCDLTWDNQCNPGTGLGAVYGDGTQLAYQFIGIFSTVAYSFVMTYLIIKVLAQIMDISTIDHHNEGVDQLDYCEAALPDPGHYYKTLEESLERRVKLSLSPSKIDSAKAK